MAIGARIKFYRDKAGWTLLQLSEASEVDVGTISALENRDSNRSKFFLPIAKALGLTLEQLADTDVDHPIRPATKPPPALPEPYRHSVQEEVPRYIERRNIDQWTAEAIETLTKLSEEDRRAAVLNLRVFVYHLGSQQDGHPLSLAA